METKMFSFYLTDEISKALDYKVLREGGDRSSLVREILSHYLAEELKKVKEWEAEKLTGPQKRKKEAWEYARGMAKINGIDIDDNFKNLIEKEIMGEITTDDIRKILNEQYGVN